MNALAAMALAAGELVCEFEGGTMMLYSISSPTAGAVLQSDRAGRRPMVFREERGLVQLVQDDGFSIRTTALTACTRTKQGACIRFEAAHAWHFDHRSREFPVGAARGRCEPWRID